VLFREGRKLADAGDFAGACAKFRESRRLDPALGTTFNIADCEERQGHLADAWSLFTEVAQLLPASDKRRAIAEARARALEPRLPRLKILLAGDAPDGTTVSRDGVELGHASLGVELPVNPGEHVVTVAAPGRTTAEHPLRLGEGERAVLDVSAGAPLSRTRPGSAPPRGPATAADEGDGSSKTVGYVLGGIGIAGALTGAIAGALVLQKKAVVDDNCNAEKRCNGAGLDAARAGKTLGIVTTAGIVTGVIGLGGGAYFLLTAGPTEDGDLATRAAFSGRF
jgi:hypothetical protein